jgi:hypothetical protein
LDFLYLPYFIIVAAWWPACYRFGTHHEVEGIWWKRNHDPALSPLNATIAAFNEDQLAINKKLLAQKDDRYIDTGRLPVSEKDRFCPGMDAVWKERHALSKTFRNVLRLRQLSVVDLFIQPAKRTEKDTRFHVDYGADIQTEKERLDSEIIMLTVAHKGMGTQAIPRSDAGDGTPDAKSLRVYFNHVRTLENLVIPQTHDVLIAKSGENGTIHRAPNDGDGLRWWSFYLSNPLYKIRRNFASSDMDMLKSRYDALQL